MRHALTGAILPPRLQRIICSNFHRASRRLVLRALSSRFFPTRFFARNLGTLAAEPGWQALSVRSRRISTLHLLLERSRFFLEVKAWREAHGLLPAAPVLSGVSGHPIHSPPLVGGVGGEGGKRDKDFRRAVLVQAEPPVTSQGLDMDSYCDHCGACCEIASGLTEFPRGMPIPSHWQHIFGQGLGPWHRFCPFLWEDRSTGHSLCAIHPWRPLACRAFEQDECDFLRREPAMLYLQY